MDGRVYTATKTVRLIGRTTVGIYIGSFLGQIEPGKYLDIEVYPISSPFSVFKSSKKITKKGSSVCVTFDHEWGFKAGDVAIVKYKSLDVDPEYAEE